MNRQTNKPLVAAGIGSTSVAILHILIMVIGAPAYRFFGAGETLTSMAETGSFFPPLVTTGITLVFIIFALYAFAGSGTIRPLPLLKPVLATVGVIFSLRGLAVLYFIYLFVGTREAEYIKDIIFSLVSLAIGLLYLAGGYRARTMPQKIQRTVG